MQDDWLTPLDDGLVGRQTRCTLCGRGPIATWGICGVAGLAGGAGGAVSYVLCAACRAQASGLRAVETLLEARYGKGQG